MNGMARIPFAQINDIYTQFGINYDYKGKGVISLNNYRLIIPKKKKRRNTLEAFPKKKKKLEHRSLSPSK